MDFARQVPGRVHPDYLWCIRPMVVICVSKGDMELATAFESVLPEHECCERRQADDLEREVHIKPKETQDSVKADVARPKFREVLTCEIIRGLLGGGLNILEEHYEIAASGLFYSEGALWQAIRTSDLCAVWTLLNEIDVVKAMRRRKKPKIRMPLLWRVAPDQFIVNYSSINLQHAARKGDRDIVLCLLEYGMDVNFAKRGDPPLVLAALEGHFNLIDPLLRWGAIPDAISKDGYTVIDIVLVESASKEAACCLVEHGANVSAGSRGANLLIKAVRLNWRKAVEVFLSHGADIEQPSDENEGTALCIAAAVGFLDVTVLLLQQGANIEAVRENENNATTICLATARGHEAVVGILLDYGAKMSNLNGMSSGHTTFSRVLVSEPNCGIS